MISKIRMGLAGLAALAIGALFTGQSPPPPPTLFPVTCADTTGVIECGPAMQAAEDACAASPGGSVVYPAGELLNRTGVIVRSGCRHTGQGSQLWRGNGKLPGEYVRGSQGTYISQTLVAGQPPANSAFTLGETATGAIIEHMAFIQDHGPDLVAFTPYAYKPSIRTPTDAGAGGFVLRHLLFVRVDRAIQLGNGVGAGSGLITVTNSVFNCFRVCINTVFAGDFNTFHDLKFSSHLIPGSPNQINYIRNNAVGIASARADDSAYSQIRMFGQRIGFLFTGNSSGASGKLQLTDYDCDGCNIGAYFNWSGANVTINGMNFRGVWASSVGIQCVTDCRLRATNVAIENAGISAVLAWPETPAPAFADIAITNLDVIACNADYNGLNQSWPALMAGNGGRVTVSGRWSFSGGNCTAEKSGDVRTANAN